LDMYERATLHLASKVVATSTWAAQHLSNHHDLATVHAIPPGTDPAPPAPGGDGRSQLLCVASVTPRKGHDVLLRALAGLSETDWELTCAGAEPDPDHMARLREFEQAHGLSDRVHFTGALTGRALEAAYARADLLVLPSRAETYGMVIGEALARGVPVIASAVGGVAEALGHDLRGHRPGLLVPADEPRALREALHRWLTDPVLRKELRVLARLTRPDPAGWTKAAQDMAAVLARERPRCAGPRPCRSHPHGWPCGSAPTPRHVPPHRFPCCTGTVGSLPTWAVGQVRWADGCPRCCPSHNIGSCSTATRNCRLWLRGPYRGSRWKHERARSKPYVPRTLRGALWWSAGSCWCCSPRMRRHTLPESSRRRVVRRCSP